MYDLISEKLTPILISNHISIMINYQVILLQVAEKLIKITWFVNTEMISVIHNDGAKLDEIER